MSFLNTELVSLVLYAAQQLGVVLAVGGQTIMLMAYLIAMRDRVVDPKEAQYYRAVRNVLVAGLGLIVLSGLSITALHYQAGELGILLSPAYLFKWLLVVAAVVFTFLLGGARTPTWVSEGLAGGTWFALFFLHILAPVATWEALMLLYGGWLAAFFLCWSALVYGTRLPAQAGERAATPTVQKPVAKPSAVFKQPLTMPDIPSARVQPPPAPPLPPLPQTPKVAVAQIKPTPAFATAKVPAPAPAKPTPVLSAVPAKPVMQVVIPASRPLAPVPVAPVAAAPKEVTLTPPKKLETPLQPPSAPHALAQKPIPQMLMDPGPANLPAMRIMPKGPEDLGSHDRPLTTKQ